MYNKDRNVLAVEVYNNLRGKPNGMSVIYTIEDGFKLGTSYKTGAFFLVKNYIKAILQKKKTD